MSFDFSSVNQPMRAGAAYKDGSGMGGGGMYFKQGKKKRKDQPDDDLFERKEEKFEVDIMLSDVPSDIPQDNIVNKFVNWFRMNKD